MPEDVQAGRLGLDISPYLAQLEAAAQKANALTAQVKAAGDAQSNKFAEAAQQALAYSNNLARAQEEVRNAAAATRSAADEVRRLTDANRELAAAQKGNSNADEVKRLGAEIAKNTAKIKEAKQAILDNRAATDQERQAVIDVREARRVATNQAKLEAAQVRDVAAAEKEVAVAAKQANTQQSDAGIQLGKSSGGFLGTLRALGPAVAAAFSVEAIKEFVGNVNEASKNLDAIKSKLNFATGSPEAAARELSFLRNEAGRLGLDLSSTALTYGSFVAAAKEGNVSLVEARRTFLAVAGASASLKLSAADTQGVLLALQQIVSKGTVSAEELRGQIGERLPGAFSIAARAIGVTESQLNKLLQSGSVISAQFLPKFTRELEKTFGDGSAQAADALQANENRINNEWQAFLLRFEGLAGATTGVIAKFAAQANRFLDSFTTAGRLRQATAGAQQGIKDYGDQLDGLFTAAATRAKKNGQEVGLAVENVAKQQADVLQRQLVTAQQELAKFDTSTKEGALFQGNFEGGSAAFNKARLASLQRVELIKGEQAAIAERAAAFKQAADAEATQLGRIQALRAKIAADTKLRDEAPDTKEGNAERVRLNALLKDENKLLDELLGKEEKVRKARQYSYESQLRALLAERATLTSLAAKASEQMATDAATRARLVFEEGLRQVDIAKGRLEQRELALRAAATKAGASQAVGRLGEKADGVVDGVQEDQLNRLRVNELDKYYNELGRIEREREQRLFDLRADSDEKEVEAVNRKYERLIAAARDGVEQQALAEAQAREQLALRAAQQQRESDRLAGIAQSNAGTVGDTFGQGTGTSVFEAKRKEKQLLLDIEKKHAEDVLNNSLLLGVKEGEVQRAAAERSLAQVKQAQKALDRENALADFSIYKLIFGENDSPELRDALDKVVSQAVNSFAEITNAQQQAAANRAATATQNISELSAQLTAEVALNREGSASNIKGIQDQINTERQLRREALEEQRTAAKQKVAIDTLTQASSVATAAAEVFAVFAGLGPLGVIGGAVAAAGLIAAFVAAKVNAFQAASSIGQGSFFKGGFTGEGDPHGVSTKQGPRPYEYHNREFIMNHELTDEYRHPLFEPLHNKRPQDIDWTHPSLQAILPDYRLPQQLKTERAESLRISHEHSYQPLKAEFGQMNNRLAAIEATNQKMAEARQVVPLGNGYMLVDPVTGSSYELRIR